MPTLNIQVDLVDFKVDSRWYDPYLSCQQMMSLDDRWFINVWDNVSYYKDM